jgi:hypothetical protein
MFYKIYHGNLAFSSIEEDSLEEVIDQTYFPLLNLVEKENLKIGLEINAYSLEKIQKLKPHWIEKFKNLHKKGLVELIGSGYMQIIGPLVPYEINIKNQKIGLEIYEKILNITPTIAYINEQVFSKSMVDIYSEIGYKAIVMEWNNAYSIHPRGAWKKEYAFEPVIAKGLNSSLPILWTDTILFQQFQKVVHQEYCIDEYIDVLKRYIDLGYKVLSIYSSDLEIFNFRPGRFKTETKIKIDEWKMISKIIKRLKKYAKFYLPSEILDKLLKNNIKLDLTTFANPIIVKKQSKYSLSRWAACGRGANYINTLCYNYYIKNGIDKKLLQFWGSDYRTHTTIKKWEKAINFLENKSVKIKSKNYKILNNDVKLIEKNKKLIFEKNYFKIVFNKQKGMTLDKVYKNNKKLQFGTVKHGELDYITHGADFYTGTTTIESADTKKIADLLQIEKYSFYKINKNKYKLSTIIKMKDVAIEYKSWIIDLNEFTLTLDIKLKLNNFINGSIRLGTLTLLPQDKKSNFWYECKNGGKKYERFYINDKIKIEHSQARSLIQSSSGGIGVTNGVLRLGIDENIICEIKIDREKSYPFVMLQNSYDHDKYLTRLFFGVQELDDTLKVNENRIFNLRYSIKI